MTLLLALWRLSLFLCAMGALALVTLIMVRIWAARIAMRRQETRRSLLPLLLGSTDDVVDLGPLRGWQLAVAATLTCELAELTRGSSRDALLERATALGVPALLEKRIHARSPQVRLTAVEVLALFEQCGEQAQMALDDPNPDVRLGAALALAQRADAPPPVTLVNKLRVGTEERSLLLVSLMADLVQRDQSAVAAMLLDRNLPYEAKLAATDALADSGTEYAPLLAQLAHETASTPDVQPRIYRALGRIGHPAGAAAIMAGLQSDEWPVRASASEAAGKSGLVTAAERLGELLDDPNWWVRYRASQALLRLGPRGLAILWSVAESPSDVAKSTAKAMLAEARAA